MTLGELRAALLLAIQDVDQSVLDTQQAHLLLNMATKHVASWADTLEPSLFIATASVTVATGGTGPVTIHLRSGESAPTFGIGTATPFRRPLAALRTNHADGVQPLAIVDFEERDTHLGRGQQELPKLCMAGGSVQALAPVDGVAIDLSFVHSLPDMTTDSDTPGQSGGSGTANALPIEYHSLIVSYAAILAISGEHGDANEWKEIFGEQKEQLQLSLQSRRGKRMGKP